MKTLGFLGKNMGNLAEKLEEGSNIIKFGRVDRSGGGERFGGPDWLSPMKVGARFLARAYGFDGSSLIEYTILHKTEKAVYMAASTKELIIVDPKRFTMVTELVEELKDEQCNRSDQ